MFLKHLFIILIGFEFLCKMRIHFGMIVNAYIPYTGYHHYNIRHDSATSNHDWYQPSYLLEQNELNNNQSKPLPSVQKIEDLSDSDVDMPNTSWESNNNDWEVINAFKTPFSPQVFKIFKLVYNITKINENQMKETSSLNSILLLQKIVKKHIPFYNFSCSYTIKPDCQTSTNNSYALC
jgi:hypothetical protein